MMKNSLRYAIMIILLALIIIGGRSATGITINVSGGWVRTITDLDLQSGAGSDLNNTYQSASDAVRISVFGVGGGSWRVDVRKSDTNWRSDFRLYVRRTSNGIGFGGSISGGTSYQEVTDIDEAFFNGTRNRFFISVQLQMDGVSAQIPADTYSTTVYYTAVDI